MHYSMHYVMHQVELPGFDADAATVHCCNLGEAHVLQVDGTQKGPM